jgi:hypothetical protein
MAPQSFAERVLKLEEQMTSLQALPKRIDDLALQVSQLRTDMQGEFSAVRSEMATGLAAVRSEMATKADLATVRSEMATKADLAAVRAEIKEGDEETRRQMRVLHEDVISRFTLLQEGIAASSLKKPSRRSR